MMEPKKLSLAVGRNLKKLIRCAGYKSQDAFAYAYGTDVRTVGRWINHGMRDLDVIEQIAEFLGVDIFELLRY